MSFNQSRHYAKLTNQIYELAVFLLPTAKVGDDDKLSYCIKITSCFNFVYDTIISKKFNME